MNQRTRYIKIFILIIVLVVSAAHVVFDTKFWSDEHHQLSAAVTYNDGHGICFPYADISHPDNTVYQPVTQWPTGYSYCLSFMIRLTHSFVLSVILLQLLAVVVFYSGYLLILHVFENFLKKETASIALVVIGLSTATFGFYSTTDFLAIAFYVFGLALLLRCAYDDKVSFFIPVLAAVFLFFCVFFRYAYYPFVFILPLYFLFWSAIRKNRAMAIVGSISFFCILAFVLVNIFVINSHVDSSSNNTIGGIGNLNSPGLYWNQLKSIDFTTFLKSLIDDRILFSIFKFVFPEYVINFITVIISLSVLSSLLYFARTTYLAYKNYSCKNTWFMLFFILLALLLIVINYSFLAALSLITPGVSSDIYDNWTFVGELRYYAPTYILVVLSVIVLLYNTEVEIKRIDSIRKGFILVLIVSVIYNVYSSFVTVRSKVDYFSITERKLYSELATDNRFVHIKALGVELKNNGINPVYVSTNRSRWLSPVYGFRMGDPAILKADFSNCKSSLVVLSERQLPIVFDLKDFCFRNKYQFRRIDGENFFIYVLSPSIGIN